MLCCAGPGVLTLSRQAGKAETGFSTLNIMYSMVTQQLHGCAQPASPSNAGFAGSQRSLRCSRAIVLLGATSMPLLLKTVSNHPSITQAVNWSLLLRCGRRWGGPTYLPMTLLLAMCS